MERGRSTSPPSGITITINITIIVLTTITNPIIIIIITTITIINITTNRTFRVLRPLKLVSGVPSE